MLTGERREEMVRAAIAGALTLVDPAGVAKQVSGAVMHRARVGGGSFLGRVIALIGNLTGQRRRRADPGAYLDDWRNRGALGRVLNPVREAMVEAAAAMPPESRGRVLDSLGAPSVERDLERVLDRATHAEATSIEVPGSAVWPVIGALQVVAGAVLLFAIAWLVTLFVAGGSVPVATFEVPILGPLPIPLALLTAALVASAVLGWLLGLHASWVGRRVAGRISSRVEQSIRQAIVRDAFAPLDRVEAARRAIAAALR
jgi:hypothetical protein